MKEMSLLDVVLLSFSKRWKGRNQTHVHSSPIGRKKGTATQVLKELEVWAKELGKQKLCSRNW